MNLWLETSFGKHGTPTGHTILCDVSGRKILLYNISQRTYFPAEDLMNMKDVFEFLYKISETFLRTERDMIKNIYWLSCKVTVIFDTS